jgi:hypothetical protein
MVAAYRCDDVDVSAWHAEALRIKFFNEYQLPISFLFSPLILAWLRLGLARSHRNVSTT